MHRLRRRRDLKCFALLALALQLLLSFGHVHVARAAHGAAPLACRTFFQPGAEHGCPPYRQEEKCCAICWTVTVSGSLILHEPSALAPPALLHARQAREGTAAFLIEAETSAFDARGPPGFLPG